MKIFLFQKHGTTSKLLRPAKLDAEVSKLSQGPASLINSFGAKFQTTFIVRIFLSELSLRKKKKLYVKLKE